MKRILDSVHGYIIVERDYCNNIIDTEYFQRLRRIEQTSSRAIFPSARHDRFIHSLGVFHLGNKIIESLEKYLSQLESDDQLDRRNFVYESYRIACLLHDIAHSPFSHTFEEFYDNQYSDLRGILCQLVNEKQFKDDWYSNLDPSVEHERMSAIVALGVYGDFIENRKASKELVVRMIIGLKYSDKIHHSFENAMINMIHGEVIDADGLDYVCRDAWASGYSTTNVDVERLIDSIKIVKDEHGIYHLCYTTKCLNEIESVLKVKSFQQFYVINHHTVAYEQKLLVKAIESAAVYHFFGKVDVTDKSIRKEALERLCNIKCFYNVEGAPGIITDDTNIEITLPMDDDFIALMKPVRNDKYIKQWLGRKYDLVALWKSKADFYQIFDNLRDVVLKQSSWIFHDDCRLFISKTFEIPEDDIWIERATPKYKENYARKVELLVNNNIIGYQTLFPADVHSYEPPQNEFCYIYVPRTANKSEILEALKIESSKFFMKRS